jgi:hypothetical protein
MRVLVGVDSPLDVLVQAFDHPPAHVVVAHQTDRARARAERRDVAGGVARAAGHDLRAVVFEDQYRRFARDPRDTPVDEFIRDEIADDEHARLAEAIHDLEQACRFVGGPE